MVTRHFFLICAVLPCISGCIKKRNSTIAQAIYETALLEAQAPQGDIYLSIELFKKIQDDTTLPENLRTQAANNRAVLLCRLGEFTSAQEIWEQLSRDSGYATPEVALYNLGLLKYKDNDIHKACYYLEQAIVKAPLYTDAHFYVGLCYYAQQHYVRARSSFSTVLHHAPEHTAARSMLALLDK